MGKKLILTGVVQGVFCRNYCSQYAKHFRIHGSASNLPDGNVRVILDTDNMELINQYIHALKTNPRGIVFYGSIDDIELCDHKGHVFGDYTF